MSWSPRFSKLIKLLPLTWFSNLVNLLPSEQLEISGTGRLGLQGAVEEDQVLWWSLGGTSTALCPPSPPSWVAPALHSCTVGQGSRCHQWGRRAECQVPPTLGFWGFGTGELVTGSSDPCHLPAPASSCCAGSWPPAGLQRGPWCRMLAGAPHHQHRPSVFWKSHFLFFD